MFTNILSSITKFVFFFVYILFGLAIFFLKCTMVPKKCGNIHDLQIMDVAKVSFQQISENLPSKIAISCT